ncbi:MAG: TonB family protein [Candidatus Acidiferrales bacterium]
MWENVDSLLRGPRAPKEFEEGRNFRGCYLKARAPRRSIFTSFLWHAIVAALLIQFGAFLWTPTHVAAMPDFELTWSGPVKDLPLLAPRGPGKKVSPPGDPAKPVPPKGADAFHPRQTIISAPRLPTHPRQTLIQPDMPPEAPKILPPLPNMVVWQPDEPARPKLQISAEEFAKMHPNQPIPRQNREVAVPELPNQERNPADVNISALPDPARPALRINSGSSTINAPKPVPTAASSIDPPPDVAPTGGNQRVIAISAMPAPVPPPAQMPAGNLSSRVTISPDGPQPGVPGGSANGAAGNGGAGGNSTSPGGNGNTTGGGKGTASGVSITGGDQRNPSSTSGLGGSPYSRNRLPSLHITPGMTAKPTSAGADAPASKPADASVSGRIHPGDPPERIFGERAFYTMHINSPNISSKMGSWELKFAELDDAGSTAADSRRIDGKLSGPVPTHKVDPRYPPALIQEHVQGDVVLYAIIRENGSVDSVQVLRPLDPVLDQNAMEAFAAWKFQPGSRNGVPVALEAVVHIPFRISRPD